jgi:hypothetical protein
LRGLTILNLRIKSQILLTTKTITTLNNEKFTLHYYSYSYLLHQHKLTKWSMQQQRTDTLKPNYTIIKAPNAGAGLWTTYATHRDHQNENNNTIFDLYSENPDLIYTLFLQQNNGIFSDAIAAIYVIPQSTLNLHSNGI